MNIVPRSFHYVVVACGFVLLTHQAFSAVVIEFKGAKCKQVLNCQDCGVDYDPDDDQCVAEKGEDEAVNAVMCSKEDSTSSDECGYSSTGTTPYTCEVNQWHCGFDSVQEQNRPNNFVCLECTCDEDAPDDIIDYSEETMNPCYTF